MHRSLTKDDRSDSSEQKFVSFGVWCRCLSMFRQKLNMIQNIFFFSVVCQEIKILLVVYACIVEHNYFQKCEFLVQYSKYWKLLDCVP